MKRIVIIYNPRSTHHESVQRNVIDKARCLRGVMLAKYEVADTDVDDNTAKLAKIISDGDFVIAAGGDGTANIALNGVIVIILARKISHRITAVKCTGSDPVKIIACKDCSQ